jgi:hypothetical protein
MQLQLRKNECAKNRRSAKFIMPAYETVLESPNWFGY